MKLTDLLTLARSHVNTGPMASSAAVCLADAEALAAKGDDRYAAQRALASLAYSVGVVHPDYQTARMATRDALVDAVNAARESLRDVPGCARRLNRSLLADQALAAFDLSVRS